jgi:multiple sugar transport system permease protein
MRLRPRSADGDGRGWFLVLPFLAGSLVLVALPAIASLAYSLFHYDGLSPPEFAGFDNIAAILRDPVFRGAVRSSLIIAGLAIPLRLAGALGLALLLHRKERLSSAGRVAAYVPVSTPEVATALVWLWIVNPVFGPVGVAAGALGFDAGPLLLDPLGARLTIVALAAFALGEGFLVLLAARRELPDTVYEAARLEGAGGSAIFRRVTLPLLTPALSVLLVRDIALSLQATMVPTILLTRGGPDGATTTLPLLIYEEGFSALRFGDAAAIALILAASTAVLAALQFRLLRRFAGAWAS